MVAPEHAWLSRLAQASDRVRTATRGWGRAGRRGQQPRRAGALGGTRTRTGAGLSRLPLPLGYEGRETTLRAQQIEDDPVEDVGLRHPQVDRAAHPHPRRNQRPGADDVLSLIHI